MAASVRKQSMQQKRKTVLAYTHAYLTLSIKNSQTYMYVVWLNHYGHQNHYYAIANKNAKKTHPRLVSQISSQPIVGKNIIR